MTSDETLYRHFQAGDENALHELMERYGSNLTFYINGYIHDVHDAEDLMIEAFSYIVVKKPAIRDNGFKPYLYQSARHLAIRYIVKARRQTCFSFDELRSEQEGTELVDEVVSTEERNQILRMCMEQLNPDYCEAPYLIYFENMSYKETATVMGKSEKQIDNLVQRGKKSLRVQLEKEGIADANH